MNARILSHLEGILEVPRQSLLFRLSELIHTGLSEAFVEHLFGLARQYRYAELEDAIEHLVECLQDELQPAEVVRPEVIGDGEGILSERKLDAASIIAQRLDGFALHSRLGLVRLTDGPAWTQGYYGECVPVEPVSELGLEVTYAGDARHDHEVLGWEDADNVPQLEVPLYVHPSELTPLELLSPTFFQNMEKTQRFLTANISRNWDDELAVDAGNYGEVLGAVAPFGMTPEGIITGDLRGSTFFKVPDDVEASEPVEGTPSNPLRAQVMAVCRELALHGLNGLPSGWIVRREGRRWGAATAVNGEPLVVVEACRQKVTRAGRELVQAEMHVEYGSHRGRYLFSNLGSLEETFFWAA